MKFVTFISAIKTAVLFFAVAMANTNTAIADHTVIVKPQTERNQSGRRTGRFESGRHQSRRNNEARYRGPYLTTYFGGGIGSGGDSVGSFTDNFGDRDDVRSGGGFLAEGGLLAAIAPSTMLRLTAGYEVDSTSRFNGNSTFDRVRFDLMLLQNFGGHELGVGLTAHTGVGFRCDINTICATDVEFDDALGYTLEYALTTLGSRSGFGAGYDRRRHPLRTARLGLRFTDIEYRPDFTQTFSPGDEGFGDDVLDGKSLSLFVGFAF